jgi:formylglycine-generating enzyme required for sulfatase activity
MARNWAITIGIDNYRNLQGLKYAQKDADALKSICLNDLGCEANQVYHFSDNSPAIAQDYGPDLDSCPTYATLRRFLRVRFEQPFLGSGDNFWFFFAGHGCRHEDRDYLLPIDGDPGDIPNTAIPLHYVTERLQRCGADNVILFVDACRSSQGQARQGLGIGEERLPGVITVFSCSPREASYEIDELEHGAFTYALLESLALRGEDNCATVERLYHRLSHRVPQLNGQYGKPAQNPYGCIEPLSKNCLILLPQKATLTDVKALKLSATQAELKGQSDIAKQFWTRVLAASPADPDAIEGIERLAQGSVQPAPAPSLVSTATARAVGAVMADGSSRVAVATVPPRVAPPRSAALNLTLLPTCSFESLTLSDRGEAIACEPGTVKYWREDLGNDITLDLVAIPGGHFMQGFIQNQSYVPPFLMGKYPVTQAQWRAVAQMAPIDRPLSLHPSGFTGDHHPVEQVSWQEAVEFCQRLSHHTQRQYRLPSEVQWEYACRAGTTGPFHFGSTITTEVANYRGTDSDFGSGSYGHGPRGTYRKGTTPVGSFPFANPFGLYDMHGNVWEWCQDPWRADLDLLDLDEDLLDLAWELQMPTSSRILRGGSWFFAPRYCRSSYRNRCRADYRLNSIGFRIVCILPWQGGSHQ